MRWICAYGAALGGQLGALDLRVWSSLPDRAGAVRDAVFHTDAVLAALKDVSLRNLHSLVIRPREWNTQLRCIAQRVVLPVTLERCEMCRTHRAFGASKAGLQQVFGFRAVPIHEPHGLAAAFHFRIAQQVGSLDGSAALADVEVEHIGTDVNDAWAGVLRVGCSTGFRAHRAGSSF